MAKIDKLELDETDVTTEQFKVLVVQNSWFDYKVTVGAAPPL